MQHSRAVLSGIYNVAQLLVHCILPTLLCHECLHADGVAGRVLDIALSEGQSAYHDVAVGWGHLQADGKEAGGR